jgi:hypothetical protein
LRYGTEKKAVIEDISQWCRESFALGKVIAEDVSQSLEMGTKIAIQTINATTAASQAADIGRATADFLGFAGEAVDREIEVPFSTPVLNKDGKAENQEIPDFLQNSTQRYVGFKNVERTDLLSLCLIISESVQYSKMAHFFPLAKGAGFLPGEVKSTSKQSVKNFESLMEALKNDGTKVVSRRRKNGFNNSPGR